MRKWEQLKGLSGKSLKLGPIHIGEYFYDGGTNCEDTKKYKVNCHLPGFKNYLGHYETDSFAAQLLESALDNWLKLANLKEVEGE